jgi:two-component system phosphate regulon sensor histidine kinase PhoR
MSAPSKLAILIKEERVGLLARWRHQVRELPSARPLDVATLNDHMPGLLDELAEALEKKSDQSIPAALAEGSPPDHGRQRLQDGYDIQEVIAEYNVLRGCIHQLADDHALNLQGGPLHIINRVFDCSIGLAVQTYATERALEVRRRREEYLTFIAHDLRTPLSAISLAERVLNATLTTAAIDPESSQMLGVMRRSLKQLEDLVAQVLEENMRLDAEVGMNLFRRELDLWPFVASLILDCKPLAATSSTLLTNQIPDGLIVYADASLLRRVLQNLLGNGIKYAPNGEIVVGARPLDADGTIELWVSDNGQGIPQDFLEKIFEKGESDPSDAGGLGLGLAIVKTVIEAHGGQVSVESHEGVGSTFRFSLPPKAAASAA